MVTVLLFCNVTTAYSMGAAGEILVTGGTASANPVALAVGLLLLGGAGIDIVVTDLAEDKGMTKSEYLDSPLHDFADSCGKAYDDLVNELAEGVECTKNGYLIIGERCSAAWGNFINYLFDSGAVGSSIPLEAYGTADNNVILYRYNGSLIDRGDQYEIYSVDGEPMYIAYEGMNAAQDTAYIRIYSLGRMKQRIYNQEGVLLRDNWATVSATGRSFYEVYMTVSPDYIQTAFPENVEAVPHGLVNADVLNSLVVVGEGTVSGQLVGDKDRYAEGVLGGIGALEGQSVIARPDILDVPGALDTDLTIPFPDYIDKLLELLNSGAIADVPVAVENNDGLPADRADTAVEPVQDMGEFTYDVKEIFPFCIPFDIYDMFNLLVSGREAPHFEYRFYVPGVVDYTMEFDFAMFEPLADVMRKMELLAFCIGLAFVTKSLIKW